MFSFMTSEGCVKWLFIIEKQTRLPERVTRYPLRLWLLLRLPVFPNTYGDALSRYHAARVPSCPPCAVTYVVKFA